MSKMRTFEFSRKGFEEAKAYKEPNKVLIGLQLALILAAITSGGVLSVSPAFTLGNIEPALKVAFKLKAMGL